MLSLLLLVLALRLVFRDGLSVYSMTAVFVWFCVLSESVPVVREEQEQMTAAAKIKALMQTNPPTSVPTMIRAVREVDRDSVGGVIAPLVGVVGELEESGVEGEEEDDGEGVGKDDSNGEGDGDGDGLEAEGVFEH
jgi:hypothetical protein